MIILYLLKTKKDVSRDGIYAFTTTHGLFVKRIQRRVDGKLDIISDNKDYPLTNFKIKKIWFLGKVISSFGLVY